MSYTLDQLIENGSGYVHQDILEQARAEVDAELAASKLDHCQCPACCGGIIHKSDCAVHNMPHEPNGNCDCMAEDYEALWESYVASRARIAELTTKYDSLEKSWIEGSSAHQETIEHMETVRDSYDRCYVENERLINEVKQLRGALVRICEAFGDIRTSADNSRFAMEHIARNALKEG